MYSYHLVLFFLVTVNAYNEFVDGVYERVNLPESLIKMMSANNFKINDSLESGDLASLTAEYTSALDDAISIIDKFKCVSKCLLTKDEIKFKNFQTKLVAYLLSLKEIIQVNENQKKKLEQLTSNFNQVYDEQMVASEKVEATLKKWKELKANGGEASKVKELEKRLIGMETELDAIKDRKNEARDTIKQSIKEMRLKLTEIAEHFSLKATTMLSTNVNLMPFLDKVDANRMADVQGRIFEIVYSSVNNIHYDHLKDEYVDLFKPDMDRETFIVNTRDQLNEVLLKIFETKTYRELEAEL